MVSKEYKHQIEEIYKSHYRQLVSYAYAFTKNHSEAEDLVQEIFTILCKAEIQANQWLPYIKTCIRHFFFKEQEKHQKRKTSRLELAGEMASNITDPFKRETILKILALMKEDYRQILLLSYEGYNAEEIAEKMNLQSTNAVYQKSKRARKEAKNIRENHGFETDFSL